MTITEIKHDVKYWQRLLRLAGYYTGKIDGIRGKLTTAAEQKWAAAEANAKRHGTFDTRTEAALSTLIPEAQTSARAWLTKATEYLAAKGLTIRVICGTRTYAEQDALYRKRPRVTNARGGYSMHNFGIAFDIGLFKDSKYLDDVSKTADKEYIALHQAIGTPEQMEWGGNWTSFKDYPHYQISAWGSGSAKLRSIF